MSPTAADAAPQTPRQLYAKDAGAFPNSALPALLYAAVLSGSDLASRFEALTKQYDAQIIVGEMDQHSKVVAESLSRASIQWGPDPSATR